jgi:Protein of unknown function (DUF418)
MLPAPAFTYSARRDTHLWKLAFAGLMAGIPASLLLTLAATVLANPAARDHLQGMLVLIVGGVLGLLLLIALVFGLLALRRVRRLRHLTYVGMPLLARVEELRILRGKYNTVAGASFWLVFEFQHETFRLQKRITDSAAIAQAQSRGSLEIAIDPQDAKHAAIVVAGRLI